MSETGQAHIMFRLNDTSYGSSALRAKLIDAVAYAQAVVYNCTRPCFLRTVAGVF